MSSQESNRRTVHPVVRALAALGLIVGFLLIASYVRPQDSPAIPMPVAQPSPGADAGEGSSDATSIGWLESPEYRVEMFATEAGPRYDVYDASGRLIAERVDREGLYRIDPTLDPENQMGTPMGLVTDEEF